MPVAAKLSLWLWAVRTLIHHRRPDVSLAFLGGLGDELLCTAPVIEWNRRGYRRIWLRTRQPELFSGIVPSAGILPDDPRLHQLAGRVGRPFRYLSYSPYDPTRDRDEPPGRHIIAEMCARAGLTGTVALRPYWYVTQAEHVAAAHWRDHVVIQTSTLLAHVPMANKQWFAARFQAVVDQLSHTVRFVQLGSAADPALRGVVDLRGQTTLRQSAAILQTARAFLGLVGFLMHLARAVDCPGVIIYGGRELPEITGYPCNLNLYRRPACSPCWQRSLCGHNRMCMEYLPAAEAASALMELLARPRGPLAVTEVEL